MSRKIAAAALLLILFPLYTFGRLNGQAKLDSLLRHLDQLKSDSAKVITLNSICFTYRMFNPDKGIAYGFQSLQLARQLHWDGAIAKAYTHLSQNYEAKGVWDSAVSYGLLAFRLQEQSGDRRSAAIALATLGNTYARKSDFPAALEYMFRALKIYEELKEKGSIALTLMNIGNVYIMTNDPKCKRHYLDALKIFKEIDDKENISLCEVNLGSAYYEEKNYQLALECFSRSLQLSREMGLKPREAFVTGNIGSAYLALGDLLLALKYAFEALDLAKQVGDSDGEIAALAEIGKAYLALAKSDGKITLPDSLASNSKNTFLQKSLAYLNNSIIKNGGNDPQLLKECLNSISQVYNLTGDYKKALETYTQYVQIKDSILSNDNKVKMAHLETKRESDLKEKQIKINSLSKKEANQRTVLLLAGIGFLLVITVSAIRSGRKQKAANQRLAAEKETSDKLRGELEETLKQKSQLMEKISDSAQMKSRFFANISHELRTPVTLLTGMLGLMKEKSEKGVDSNKLEIAFGNSLRLQHMVEEMLDLSKLESSDTTIKYTIKEVTPLVERMTNAFSSHIQQAKMSLTFETTGTEHTLIATDPEKLEKIIANLIYNAVKFSHEGGSIKVILGLSSDKKWVNISVLDTGIGINEKDLPHIFDRFYQSDSSNAKAKGAGIGLSLVREFTLLLNGKVNVTSREGQGSTFTLQFPVFEGDVKEILANTEDVAVIDTDLHFSQPYTILLVEDNAEMRYYLREVLAGSVILVEMENGKKALEWLESNQADMVITDMMMPEMDGAEFITHLKNNDKYRKLPIITVSALADLQTQLGTLRMGIDDYVVKPFNPSELRIRVRNLLVNLEERRTFDLQPVESDDIPADSMKAAEFKTRLQDFVLERIKKFDVTVYDVAYEFALSERQLYRLAKSLTGCTPAQLIKEVKLQKAYELLLNKQVSKVETLAKEVGFENISYFSKQFVERFGKKPGEFF